MSWNHILGQAFPVSVLKTHLERERVAPAYLFAGPSGVGKRLTALELAKALNCERGIDACDACGSCRRIVKGIHPDVHRIEPQGAAETIRIDDVRAVVSRVVLRPFMAKCQVVIIAQADRLTEEAANSLLKMLEEPPRQARFVLTTAQPAGCLPTITSRCQMIRFQQLPVGVVERLMQTEHGIEPSVSGQVSRLAQGSVTRGLELAKRWEAYAEKLAQLSDGKAEQWMAWPVPADREELSEWLTCSVTYLRDAVVDGHSRGLDPDRCIDATLRVIELAESLQQMGNARLLGTLFREEWLALLKSSEL